MKVNFLDLYRQHEPYLSEFQNVFLESLRNSEFVGGAGVKKFEEDFARYCGSSHCVGVSSGTSAISLALEALGIGAGDEVIVPANTFIATAEAASHVGAKPVFCDVSPVTFNVTRKNVEALITPKTKAIIGVHLYGQLCDVDGLSKLCAERNIHFIEDCAQAHGATHNGKRAGTFGKVGCFSFYPGKNLGSLGEGGAVVTNDEKVARAVTTLREHGQPRKHEHTVVGYNHRLQTLQAKFLSIKLRDLDTVNQKRRKAAQRYLEKLKGISQLELPAIPELNAHVFHLFSVFADNRDQLAAALSTQGVSTGLHYPVPCHLQEAYGNLKYKRGDFPVSERLASRQISLPMFPDLTNEEIDYVCNCIKGYYEK